jgi:zinc transport system permease protein
MTEALQYEFMQHALISGLLASVICGVIGTLVVVKRIVFIAGGVAHAAYGGVGLAFFLGLPVLASAMGFAVIITAMMAWVTKSQKHRADAVIGVLWAAGMALGVILTDLTPGYQGELISYLFGSILAVPLTEIYFMAGLALLIMALVGFFYHDFLAMSYDEDFSRVRGIPVDMLYVILLVLIAASVVFIVRVVGLILVIALLTIPPLMLERRVKSLSTMIWASILCNLLFTLAGLSLAYHYNLTSGATIISVAVTAYCGSAFLSKIRESLTQKYITEAD